MRGRIILNKPTGGSLLKNKPIKGSLINVKGEGLINKQTVDDVVVHLNRGQIIGPGFFMFLTYPENTEAHP